MYMFKLIATDLDGTLLLPVDHIGKFSKKVLSDLIQSGVDVVFATGKCHADVKSIVTNLGLPIHLITSNGAEINSHCNKLKHHSFLEQKLVKRLIDLGANNNDVFINIYTDSNWFIS